ncbi:hypothetical protein SAMN05444157_0069 [Frankineae bacterium MT45]|nr:hypothetical protein SAMN05444157_0069 [Frankineae bacterium MT45]
MSTRVTRRLKFRRYRRVVAIAALLIGAGGGELLLFGPAQASTTTVTSASTTHLDPGTFSPVNGVSVSGFTSAQQLLVSVSVDRGLVAFGQTSGLTLAFGYPTFSAGSVTFTGVPADVNAALASLQVNPGDGDGIASLAVMVAPDETGLAFSPTSGHFYRFISAPNMTFEDARVAAKATSYSGQPGYLAELTSPEINDFVTSKVPDPGTGVAAANFWIGAQATAYDTGAPTDPSLHRIWRWLDGPAAGLPLTNCTNLTGACVHAGAEGYNDWSAGEPNNADYGDMGDGLVPSGLGENAAATNWDGIPGSWLDLRPGSGQEVQGYVAEYGGLTNLHDSSPGYDDAAAGISQFGVGATIFPPPPELPPTPVPVTTPRPATPKPSKAPVVAATPEPTAAPTPASEPTPDASPTPEPSPTPSPTPTPTPGPSVAESPTAETSTQDLAPPTADVAFGFKVGQKADGATVVVTGTGLAPNSVLDVVMHSTPVSLGSVTTDSDGTVRTSLNLPASIEPGTHRLIVNGKGADGAELSSTWYFQVDKSGVATRLASAPSSSPPQWGPPPGMGPVDPSLVRVGDFTFKPYLLSAHPKAALDTQVATFTLVAVLGGAGLLALGSGSALGSLGGAAGGVAGGSGAGSAGGAEEGSAGESETGSKREEHHARKGGSLASAKVKHLKFRHEATRRGDQSRTWTWPGVAWIDRHSLGLPTRLNRFSPLAARAVADAAYLRAAVGPVALFAPIAGVILGILAVIDTHGAAVPPELGIVVAIVLLGVVDVFAGFITAVVFTAGVLCLGGIDSVAAVRTVLGVDVIFFTVTLAACSGRPLRRVPGRSAVEIFDRGADLVIAPLIGMWAMTKVVGALPALSGLDLPLAGHADELALVVGVAILVRLLGETAAAAYYPLRLAEVAPPKVGFPSTRQQHISNILKTAVFVFFAIAYLGNVWELWVGAALFLIPSIIGTYQGRLPNLPRLVRWLPGGVIKTVLMLCVGKWTATLLASHLSNPQQMVPLGFVLLGLPGLLLTLGGFLGRDGRTWNLNWAHRIGGIAVVVLGVLLVQGVVSVV